MTKRAARKIFEKYNPADAIVHCPNGRDPVRKPLDTYARAAVHLYGIISKSEFAEIFNRQNTEQTSADEVFTLLLPLVLKNKWYCFYKDYIVYCWAMDDFDYVDYVLREQGNKPRFIPEKDEFLKFEDQNYEDETQESYWNKLRRFISEEWPDNLQKHRFYSELKEISELSTGIKEVSALLDKYRLAFNGEKQVQTFFTLLTEARNNTRLWSNKGYSPNELNKILASRRPPNGQPQVVVRKRKKVDANDPCPCGSGKKYKQCCRLTGESKRAQLSRNECTLFYETWYGLMGFINGQKKVINAVIKPIYPNPIRDEQMFKICELLWENPKLIDDYLDAVKLPEDKAELLRSWRDHHQKGLFFVVDYKPEYAVAIGYNEQREGRLYGINGISRPLSDAMQSELPKAFETVLLPFKGKIIYDSFVRLLPIRYGEGAKKALREMYESELEHGIITSLE